jgi:uncharacterized damage-inducible protein DinB
MARTETHILADMLDKTRALTRFYISNLKNADPYTAVEFGGKTFNSIYWLTAHIVWAEDNLIMQGTGAGSVAPEWIRHYSIKSDGSLHEGHGDYKALLDEMKRVHQACLEHLRHMDDSELDKDNVFGFQFGDGDASNRLIIMHAIRHEGTHIGNLAWLSKMLEVQTP